MPVDDRGPADGVPILQINGTDISLRLPAASPEAG
jgi:hypothetical protein